ncbi:MAG: hypothetical protein ABIT37_07805 [Luteolibacter sp.]
MIFAFTAPDPMKSDARTAALPILPDSEKSCRHLLTGVGLVLEFNSSMRERYQAGFRGANKISGNLMGAARFLLSVQEESFLSLK